MALYTEVRSNLDRATEIFKGFTVDKRLALLWYVYEKLGHSITPAAPNAAEPAIAGGLFEQVRNMSQEEQLQVMRDIVGGVETQYTREYGGLSANTRLAFWYFLARGMTEGIIIPMPENYELSDTENEWLGAIELLDFEQQITVLRDIANDMGVDSTANVSV